MGVCGAAAQQHSPQGRGRRSPERGLRPAWVVSRPQPPLHVSEVDETRFRQARRPEVGLGAEVQLPVSQPTSARPTHSLREASLLLIAPLRYLILFHVCDRFCGGVKGPGTRSHGLAKVVRNDCAGSAPRQSPSAAIATAWQQTQRPKAVSWLSFSPAHQPQIRSAYCPVRLPSARAPLGPGLFRGCFSPAAPTSRLRG